MIQAPSTSGLMAFFYAAVPCYLDLKGLLLRKTDIVQTQTECGIRLPRTCLASLPAFPLAQPLSLSLVAVAQAEYDAWDESDLDTYAGGGICHLVADRFVQVLGEAGIEATTVSSNFEVHVFVVCKLAEGVFALDIPHNLYERGAGYSWAKVPGVVFCEANLAFDCLSANPEDFDDYLD